MKACVPAASSSLAAMAICARAETYSMPTAYATLAESLACSTTLPYPLPTSMNPLLGLRFQRGSGRDEDGDAEAAAAAAAAAGAGGGGDFDVDFCLLGFTALVGGVGGGAGAVGRGAARLWLEASVLRNTSRRSMEPSVISP
jgi:hypothetical protein